MYDRVMYEWIRRARSRRISTYVSTLTVPHARQPSPRRWQGMPVKSSFSSASSAPLSSATARAQGGATGVGDLVAAEGEHLELRQHSCRRRRRHDA